MNGDSGTAGRARRGGNHISHRSTRTGVTNLRENVTVIDASPDNLLRMSFNVDFVHQGGWARSLLDGGDWRDAGLRYTSQLDLLPFGQLTAQEREIRSPAGDAGRDRIGYPGAESERAL